MITSNLNLPIWKSSKLTSRVVAARARALKVSADIVDSIPDATASAKELESVVNKMLSSGTIKSLEEAYEVGGTSNPHPTKWENEANLDRTGYTVVNGVNFFKLQDSDNVEAIRMLYNAGWTLSEIRTKLSSLKVGDAIVVNCGKIIKQYPKQDYNELLDNYKSFRGYKEYITTVENNVYAVCDTPNGNDSTYILYVEQDTNENAFLSCQKCDFSQQGIQGTLTLNLNDVEYEFPIDAKDSDTLLLNLSVVDSPFTFSWDNGLTISAKKPFKIKQSDIAELLGIKQALLKVKEAIQLGYGGGEIIQEESFYQSPYNILLKSARVSRHNVLKIYKQLVNAGVSKDVCDAYLEGTSLYANVQNKSDALKNLLEKDKRSELVPVYADDLFKNANIRIASTSLLVIEKLLKMSDKDLEYLLRYRLDITGIDPSVPKETIMDALIKMSETSKGGYYTKKPVESDIWKQNTSNARTVQVYINLSENETNDFLSGKWLDDTYEFLDGIVYFLNQDFLEGTEDTYYSEKTLGMDMTSTVNWSASASIMDGASFSISLKNEIPTDFFDEFQADMMVIQAYLDAAFAAFDGICNKIGAIIDLLNSSLGIKGRTSAGYGLGMGSILQCSLNVDLGLNIPIYIPMLNAALTFIIDMIEAAIEALISLERSLLCPIQNLLDKYVNTEKFPLPCKVNYSVPMISGIDNYLKGYIQSLERLKALCKVSKKDSDWLKYNAQMLPGSVNLMVTDSDACKES
jgi:hypothetical protein